MNSSVYVFSAPGRLKRLLGRELGGLGLEALSAYLRSESGLELPRPTGSQHSAGYDAWVTAEVFVRQLDLWLRSDELRRRRKAELQDMPRSCRKSEPP